MTDGFKSGEIYQIFLIGVDTHISNRKNSLVLFPHYQSSLAMLLLLNQDVITVAIGFKLFILNTELKL